MAPDFSATARRRKHLQLSSLRGAPVVLFFYPKDDTPALPSKACAFQVSAADFEGVNAKVIGVIPDAGEEST